MNPRTIAFCIPWISAGSVFLEYLIDNLFATAMSPERIQVYVSYHTEQELAALKATRVFPRITKAVYAQPYAQDQTLFAPSANHSSAINALSVASDEDIVVFSDFDMAFVHCGWDALLEDYFYTRNIQLCGVTYATARLTFNVTPGTSEQFRWLASAWLYKYQNLPNLSFFCIRRDVLRNTFHSRLTDFNDFLVNGGFPYRVINSTELSKATNLAVGCVQAMDTGYELPEKIRAGNIPYAIFPYVPFTQQRVLAGIPTFESLPVIHQPEVFNLPDSDKPFLCHLKKGSSKMAGGVGETTFREFRNAVEKWLAAT